MYITNADVAGSAAIFTPPLLKRAVALHLFTVNGFFANDGSDSPIQRWSSLIGIVTAIVGNVLISFALNIQRYAHIRLNREHAEKKRQSKSPPRKPIRGYGTTIDSRIGHGEAEPLARSFDSTDSSGSVDNDAPIEQTTYLKSPYWWAGIILMIIGETGNFLAYGFAPASIVSPLGVVALVSNCVIAPIMLKERFRLRDFWGVVVAVGGAVTVVLSAKHEEKKLGPHEVIGAITTLEFEIYMAVTFVLISILAWASPKYGNRTILIDLGLVGLFGGYTALSTKGVASMLSTSFLQAFGNPITYALIVVLLGTAIMQIKYVNRALQRFDSTQVIPVQFVMFTLSVIIGSAVLYRDFESTTPERAGKFVGGCLLTFFGVFLITSGRPSHDDSDSGSESDFDSEAESISLTHHEGHPEGHYQDSSDKYAPITRTSLSRESLRSHERPDFDEDVTAYDTSRRSSHVSFAPLSRPVSPRGHPSSRAPSIRFVPPTIAAGPASGEPSPQTAHHLESPFVFAPPSSSHTPPYDSLHPLSRLTSQTGDAAALRPVTPSRHSLSKSMMPPGTFISPLSQPLSSSLSAVVADTLRRGTDVHGGKRRPRLDLRRTRSGVPRAADSDDDEALMSALGSPRKHPRRRERRGAEEGEGGSAEGEAAAGGRGGRRRARSLGLKLSDFFWARAPDEGGRGGGQAGGPGEV